MKTKTVKTKSKKKKDTVGVPNETQYAYNQVYAGLRNMCHAPMVVVEMMKSLGLDQAVIEDAATIFGDDLKAGG